MPRRTAVPSEKYLTFGLASRRNAPESDRAFHRHDEVELLYVECGDVTMWFGGNRLTLRSSQLAVFWGAVPHLTVGFAPGTMLRWLTVPLAWFLQWQLPATFSESILRGRIFARPPRPAMAAADRALFSRWHADALVNSADRRRLMLLESEAYLRRLLVEDEIVLEKSAGSSRVRPADAGPVEAMTSYIARNYTGPVTVGEIARAAGLHPDYAGALFRKSCGLGLVDYLTAQRLSHAQRLLATTDAKIIDIAFAAGFGSASRFYAAFLGGSGQTPRRYRETMQATTGHRTREPGEPGSRGSN